MGNQAGCCAGGGRELPCGEDQQPCRPGGEEACACPPQLVERIMELELLPAADGPVNLALDAQGQQPQADHPLRMLQERARRVSQHMATAGPSAATLRQELSKKALPAEGSKGKAGGKAKGGRSTSLNEFLGGEGFNKEAAFRDATFVSELEGASEEWHGPGVVTWPDGRVYAGSLAHGAMHGEATMSWPDGRMYAGQYVRGKKQGEGAFVWPDGRRYVGQWHDGMRHGWGLYTNAKGECRVGNFVRDLPGSWEPASARPPRYFSGENLELDLEKVAACFEEVALAVAAARGAGVAPAQGAPGSEAARVGGA